MTRASAWALLAVIAGAAPAASAGVLHLQGGGTIASDHWWIEDDTLKVESDGGVIGVPRSLLVRVDPAGAKAQVAKDRNASLVLRQAEKPTHRVRRETAEKMNEGNAALSARDFDRAALRFYEVVTAEPEEPGPRIGYAAAEMARGRDAMALPMILDGLAKTPGSAGLHEMLGILRDRDERVEDALTSWREAFRLAPSDRVRDRIVKAERELAAGRDYAYSAAAHFTLRYDGALDQDLMAALTDFLEDRYREFTSVYRHSPSQPITVLLYPEQAFRDVTQAGAEVAGLYDGKIRVPLGGLKKLDREAARVLSHELTHAIVQSKSRGNCPRWLHEGLAQIAEGRTLRRSEVLSVARVVSADSPQTWPDAAFSYPAALSLTRFLENRRSFDLLVALLGEIGDGVTPDAAFSSLYGATYAELAAAWAESLHREGEE